MGIIHEVTNYEADCRNTLLSDLVIVDIDHYQLSLISPPGSDLISID